MVAGCVVNDVVPPNAGIRASRMIAMFGCEFTEMSDVDIAVTLEQSCLEQSC
jgi:hypothetical protein